MTALPIRRVTLYKHGVGFFERQGQLTGTETQLTFRRDEVNDALKSLTAFDRGQGQVLGIHYQTPEDKQARLGDSSVVLSDEHSLLDLLKSLRGREVALRLDAGEQTGRLVGVDIDEEHPLEKSAVAWLEDTTVQILSISALRGVRVLDARAAHDVRFFLDTAMSEEVRRIVTLRLSEGAHDLVVQYIAPSPTWRVSYRLVAEREDDEGGQALLQGWGLFDNRLDEDLENVAVSLVAGQPISFVYDLATSRIPARPVIEDRARVAAAPVEYAAPAPMVEAAAAPPRLMKAMAAPLAAGRARGPALADYAASAPAQAETSDLGELFGYTVTTPVSVKRGESAMVPIIGSQLKVQREVLYNGQKMPDHPVVAARFDNSTGLTLERGPVTVIEDGEYRGEAIVPFSKAGQQVYLPYAVELGIKVTERHESTVEMAGLHLQGSYLRIDEYLVDETAYLLANQTGEDTVVTVEKPVQEGYMLFDTPAPEVTTAEFRRWRVMAPAGKTEVLTVRERLLRSRREQITDQSYDQLRRYLNDRWLDEATYRRLEGLLLERDQIAKDQKELGDLERERQEIYNRQEQVRKNLAAVGTAGEEGLMRTRLFDQFKASEDRLSAIDARVAELKADIAAREQRIQAELKQLK